MSRLSSVGQALLPLLIPVAALAAWWIGSASSTSPFFPPLSTIVATFVETWISPRLLTDVLPSLLRMLAGYGVAIVLGITFGTILGRVEPLYRALAPLIHFLRALPAVALIPVSITLLGIGDLPKILLIAFICVFPILLNTIDGVRSVDAQLEDVGRSFLLTGSQRILAIQLPSASPRIFAGMRVALAFGFAMMIVSELLGATNGIGFFTLNAQQSFKIPAMWSGMLLLGLLGALLNILFVAIEKRVLRWHYRSTGR